MNLENETMRAVNWMFATRLKMTEQAEETTDEKRRDKLNRFAHNLEKSEAIIDAIRINYRKLHAEKIYLENELKRTQIELFKLTK
jgi:hypothetical protein